MSETTDAGPESTKPTESQSEAEPFLEQEAFPEKVTPFIETEHLIAEHRLKPGAITLPETLAQSVTVMAPALSGGLITYLAAIKAGGATPLSFLLATIFCLLIGGVVAQFALHLHSAGSFYTYTVRGLGRFWGYITGILYTFGFWLAGPSVLAGASVFMSLLMADLGAPDFLTEWWVWFALGIVGIFLMSYFGIALSTRSSLVFTGFGILVLLWLALTVIFDGGAEGNTLDAFSPSAAGVSWTGVFAGVAFGLLSFTGFESSATLAEETRNPRRDVPLAILGAVTIGGLFYVAVTYATSIGYGVEAATTEWPASASGIAPLADRYASYLTDLVLFAVAIDAFFCALGITNAVSRMLYAMGREKVLPRRLGRTHHTHKTPHVAIAVFVAGSVLVTLLMLGLTTQATRDALGGGGGPLASGLYVFTEGLTLLAPPIMFGYIMLSIAGLAYAGSLASGSGRVRFMALAVGSLVASLVAIYGSLYYSFVEVAPGAGIPAPYAAIPWICLGVLVLAAVTGWWLKSTRRETWAAMGAVFE
jgi:amino acid transporter